MNSWPPYREPLRSTLLRTVTIAVVAGAILALFLGGIKRWPIATLLMLWPSFGGHWVELWFLNWLRPRIPRSRFAHALARLVVWFAGGVVLATGAYLTATVLGRLPSQRWPAWWIGGFVFIGLELVAQLALQLRGQPSFYNTRGWPE